MSWPGAYRATPSASTDSGTTHVITKAAGTVSGDLILLWCSNYNTGITVSCPGFTAYTDSTTVSGSSPVEGQLLSRAADGTEGSTFTLTSTSSGSVWTFIQAVIAAAVIDAVGAANGGHNATPAATGLTVGGGNELLLLFASAISDSSFGGTLVTPPSGFTSRVSGGSGSIVTEAVLADNGSIASGSTGTQTGSSVSAYWATQMVAVKSVAPKGGLLVMT
jgi:hypothetical protein